MNNTLPTSPLITRADDAGLSPGVNEAILACVRTGLVRNVSMIVTGPSFPEMAERMREFPEVDLGFHVTLNAEWPELPMRPILDRDLVPTLVNSDGCFLACPTELHSRPSRIEEILSETRAQIAYARSLGVHFSYLDEHMGVGWILGTDMSGEYVPGAREIFRSVAREEGLVFAADFPGIKSDSETYPSIYEKWLAAFTTPWSQPQVFVTHPSIAGDPPRYEEYFECVVRAEESAAWQRLAEAGVLSARGIHPITYRQADLARQKNQAA